MGKGQPVFPPPRPPPAHAAHGAPGRGRRRDRSKALRPIPARRPGARGPRTGEGDSERSEPDGPFRSVSGGERRGPGMPPGAESEGGHRSHAGEAEPSRRRRNRPWSRGCGSGNRPGARVPAGARCATTRSRGRRPLSAGPAGTRVYREEDAARARQIKILLAAGLNTAQTLEACRASPTAAAPTPTCPEPVEGPVRRPAEPDQPGHRRAGAPAPTRTRSPPAGPDRPRRPPGTPDPRGRGPGPREGSADPGPGGAPAFEHARRAPHPPSPTRRAGRGRPLGAGRTIEGRLGAGAGAAIRAGCRGPRLCPAPRCGVSPAAGAPEHRI